MPLLKTTLLTGARPGEISRLRWADADLDEQTAVVRGTKTTDVFEYVLSDVTYEWIDKSRYDDEFVFFGWHRKHRNPSRSHLLPLHLGKFRNLH